MYPKEIKSVWQGICSPLLIAAIFTIMWKQLKSPSTDEWIKIMWYIHTKEGY
jgi:hypothetical protein